MAAIRLKRLVAGLVQWSNPTYSPDILPRLQGLLRTLADIDFAFQQDLETIMKSSADEDLKQRAVTTLKQHHQERRGPYLRAITALEKQMLKKAA